MSYVLQGQEGFANLSEDAQSFLLNNVFGNIQANPYKKGNDGKRVVENGVQKDFSNMYAAYKSIAEKAVTWGKDHTYEMQVLSEYDDITATAGDDQNRQKFMLQML
jgi:hypothetical protein